jgi:predicted RNA-binding protein with EMAP domain
MDLSIYSTFYLKEAWSTPFFPMSYLFVRNIKNHGGASAVTGAPAEKRRKQSMELQHPAISTAQRTGYPRLVVENTDIDRDIRDMNEDIDEVIDDIKYEIELCKKRMEQFEEKAVAETDAFKRGMYRGMIEGDKSAYAALKYILQSAEANKKHAV